MLGRVWTLFAKVGGQISDNDDVVTIPVTLQRRDVETLIRFSQQKTPAREYQSRSAELHRPEISDPLSAARWLLAIESKRQDIKVCEGLFFDPAWFIMLDLYVREGDFVTTSVSSACIAAGVPPTTALRCLTMLTDMGKIVRRPDPTDQRRIFVSLSDEVHKAITAYLVQAFDLQVKGDRRARPPMPG